MASKKKKKAKSYSLSLKCEKKNFFFHMLNNDYKIQRGELQPECCLPMDGLLCFKAVGSSNYVHRHSDSAQ